MACGSGSIDTFQPLVKGYEIACRRVNLGFGFSH